ncbi:ABC transporter permease [Telmatospirillum siberiense]|uniref:ABC transporter permease n=1 Tax=Telmatospirillum siberiense TaxID=382514 RepID=A0A2N3PW72_9PROT|nr:ABC transporter permease subunit [Telmatospirillum siberiense]PKU24635.1 ABC transporter permease [Telmatospirillum siberiense]
MISRRITVGFVLPCAAVFLLFFIAPLGSIFIEALADGMKAFRQLFADPLFWRGLRGSLILGLTAPLGSVLVGFGVALHLSRLSEGLRTALMFVIALPLTFSGLIVAYGFILLLGRAGFVTLALAELGLDPATVGAFIYTPAGLGLAYGYYLIPRVVMVVLPVIRNFDASQLSAAQSLGAPAWRVYWDILLPQVFPVLLRAFCLTSAVAMGAYGTALALVGTQLNILPLLLYSKISETGADLPSASALSIVLMAICCLFIGLSEAAGGLRTRRVRS